jgi:hypothetical protein
MCASAVLRLLRRRPLTAPRFRSRSARKRTIVRSTFRFLNMGAAVMMAATGAIGLASVNDIDHAGDIFVGLYMVYVLFALVFAVFSSAWLCHTPIGELTVVCASSGRLFAAILFLFETIQIRPCDLPQRIYKRNFGFLFGVKGKAIFMIFIAFLNFGLSKPKDLALGTGIVLIVFGAVQILIHLKWPEYMEDPNTKAQKLQNTMSYNA